MHELKLKICFFFRQFWAKHCRQILKTKQMRFFYEILWRRFCAVIYRNSQNFHFGWPAGYLFLIPSTFGIFLKFCKILNLKEFGNTWGNSHAQSMVRIIWFHFTYGEKKLYENVKKSLNVLSKIADLFSEYPRWLFLKRQNVEFDFCSSDGYFLENVAFSNGSCVS